MSNSGTIGFVCLLSGFFAVLKLADLDNLSWFWVFAPLWMSALSVPSLFLIMALRVAYLKWRDARAKSCAFAEGTSA